MTTISVCIGTYGDDEWQVIAMRAIASVRQQTLAAHEIVVHHGATLQIARNNAAADATGEWLCFLDADDELDEGFIEAMSAKAELQESPALLRPATLGVYPDGHNDLEPVMLAEKSLVSGNFMVIGTLIRRDQFLRVGGFADLPVFEDWELWLRAWKDGAAFVAVPDAIYKVHVNTTGRNSVGQEVWLKVYEDIRARYR